jgi:hypothetical protein
MLFSKESKTTNMVFLRVRSSGVNRQVDRANLTPILLSLLPIAICVVLAACTKSGQTNGTDPSLPSPGEVKTIADGNVQPKVEAASGKPPTVAEAQDALERVYRRAVVLRVHPPATFVAGDFNGDGSEDIAIAVTPQGNLAELNSEFANWIVADPKKASVFDPKKGAQSLPAERGPAKVEPGEPLLAIIHGHGPNGWRDRDATQSYLLKVGPGSGMRVIPLKSFPPALKVRERGANSRADIILGTLNGRPGFLYWSPGKYAWQEQ